MNIGEDEIIDFLAGKQADGTIEPAHFRMARELLDKHGDGAMEFILNKDCEIGKDVMSGIDDRVSVKSAFGDVEGLILGDRNAEYGDAEAEFEKVGQMWSAIIGAPVTAHDFCLCMVALKLIREKNKPKRDNRIDAIGYLALGEMIKARHVERSGESQEDK